MQTETRTGPSPARPWLRVLEVLAWAVFFVAALALLAARYWLLPNVERYREDIVAAGSRALGLKITAGSIEAGWSGLRPQLAFTDVRVYDRAGREALVLPAVENVVSWRSLVARDLRLHSLAIVGPRLTIRRDAQGVIYIAGIRLGGEGGEGRLTDWVLAQNEIQIREAEIEWVDEQRGAPPLALAALNLRLHNDGDLHAIGLVARPPRELGSSLDVRAELTGRTVTEPGNWNGRVFVELGTTDLAGWRAWVDYPLDVRHGHGALRMWTSLEKGQVRRATADVALTQVVARFGADLPLLEVASIEGRLQGRETPRGYEIGLRNVALVPARGPAMQSTSLRVDWQRGDARSAAHGAVAAERIELAPLAYLADFVPVSADLRKLVADLAPGGNLFEVRFNWTGELPAAAAYRGSALFSGLEMKAWRAVPGFGGLSGRIEASESGGTLRLASSALTIDLPKVFPDPRIALQTLEGEVRWERRAADQLLVKLRGLRYASEHLAGTAQGSYEYPGQGPGIVDLQVDLAHLDGRHIGRYLPRAEILGPATRGWLVSAIREGQASEARLVLKGDLRDFPFVDPAKGQFRIAARVKDGVLDYAEGWPRIEGIAAELLFERDRMEVLGRSGRILGAAIANVRVAIPSLGAERVILTVNGAAEGPTAEFLSFIQRSPVRRMIGGMSDPMKADGRGRLQLQLELPLADLATTRVAGEYRFTGNNLIVDRRLPPIGRTAGRVAFTDSALEVSDVRGELFNGPVAISGGSVPQGGVTLTARGEATVSGIGTVFDHPWRARLAGAAPYTATVSVKEGSARIVFESSLRGVTSVLPAPLAKTAGEALPLRVEIDPAADRDRIVLSAGTTVAAEFHRVREGDALVLRRAGVLLGPGAGEAPRVPEQRGLHLHGRLRALDLDRWLPLVGAGGGEGSTSFDLRLGTLDVAGRRLNEVAIRGATEEAGWTANVKAKELTGELAYRAAERGLLKARLTHFSFPQDAPGPRAAVAERDRELPAVDLLAESFTHRGLRLGRVEVVAVHDGPNWRIDRLAVVNPEGSVHGKGLLRTGASPQTSLDLKLASSDVGRLLERLGYAERVKGGKGTLEGKVAWDGQPAAVDYGSLSGELSLHAEGGEFPRLDAGLGRLISLVGLNLVEAAAKGYPFDTLSGAFKLERGVAHTEDLKVRSSAAEITMKGDFDLAKESQSLHVRVVPSARRGVTTLATIVNPAVALGVAVGQAVLKDPIGQILASEYSVRGSWIDPKVEKIVAPPQPPSDTQFLRRE